MRFVVASVFVFTSFVTVAIPCLAQGDAEKARTVEGGGVSVPGWTGKVDASAEASGQGLNSSKFAKEGDAIRVTTGPAATYWNPANKLSGDYTVKATFT